MNRSVLWVLGFLNVLAGASLIALSGFYTDDTINAGVSGMYDGSLSGFLGFVYLHSKAWIVNQGRFFPVGLGSTYAVYSLSGYDPIIAKCVQVVAIGCAGVSTAALLSVFSKRSALFFLAVLPIFLQSRIGHDGLVSFIPILPLTIILATSSAYLFAKGFRWLALIPFTLALLTYELGIVACVLVLIVSVSVERKVDIRRLAPFVAVALLYFGASVIARNAVQTEMYSGVQVGKIGSIFPTFLTMLVSAIPLTYKVFNPNALVGSSAFDILSITAVWAAFVIFICTFFITGTVVDRERERVIPSFILGAILLIFPAALLSVSARYQIEVDALGKGYVASGMASFGLAVIVASALSFVASNASTFRIAAASCIAGCAFLVMGSNADVIRTDNIRFAAGQREAMVAAISRGDLAKLNDGGRVSANLAAPWLNADTLRMLTGKTLEISPNSETRLVFEPSKGGVFERFPPYSMAVTH